MQELSHRLLKLFNRVVMIAALIVLTCPPAAAKSPSVERGRPSDKGSAKSARIFATGSHGHTEGRVTDADGKPIAGALLEWGHYTDPPEKRQRTTTDADGRYRLDYRRCGIDYRLAISAPGKAPQWKVFYQSWLSVMPAGGNVLPPQHVDFMLEPEHRIHGIVIDQQGRPIPGVRIQGQTAKKYNKGSTFVGPTPPMQIPGEGTFETTTDANGRFHIEGLPAKEVQLNLTAPYRHLDAKNYPTDKECRITMKGSGRPGRVRGHVVDAESGKPVEEFRVVGGANPEPRAFTSADGRFVWDKPLNGEDIATLYKNYGKGYAQLIEGETCTMHIYAKGYAAVEATMKILPLDGRDETAVKLPRNESFFGRLVDARSGKPITRAPVVFAKLDKGCEYIDWSCWKKYVDGFVPPWTMVQRTITDDNGDFWFSQSIDRSQQMLAVFAPNYGRLIVWSKNLPKKDQSGRVTIRIEPEASFSGVLLKNGRPQAGVAVTVSETRKGSRTDKICEHFEDVMTDSEGRFHIGNLAPGPYQASYRCWPGRKAFQSIWSPLADFQVAAGKTKTLKPHAILGQTPKDEEVTSKVP